MLLRKINFLSAFLSFVFHRNEHCERNFCVVNENIRFIVNNFVFVMRKGLKRLTPNVLNLAAKVCLGEKFVTQKKKTSQDSLTIPFNFNKLQ